jgi:hypothetical protein
MGICASADSMVALKVGRRPTKATFFDEASRLGFATIASRADARARCGRCAPVSHTAWGVRTVGARYLLESPRLRNGTPRPPAARRLLSTALDSPTETKHTCRRSRRPLQRVAEIPA